MVNEVFLPITNPESIPNSMTQPPSPANAANKINDVQMTETENDDDLTPFTTVLRNKNKTARQNASLLSKVISSGQFTPSNPTLPNTITKQKTNTAKRATAIQAPNTTMSNPKTPSEDTTKMPPIQIHSQSANDTVTLLKTVGITNFVIKRVNDNKHTLYTTGQESYQAAKDNLSKADTPYFTYTPKSDKPKTAILRGLSKKENPEDILIALQNNAVKAISVKRFVTRRSIRDGFALPLYSVQFAPDCEWKDLIKIQSLNHQAIAWEKPHTRNEITQCMSCQRFGHTASNCNLGYRCVKCPDIHEPSKCPRVPFADRVTNDDDATDKRPYCINCNSLGHPASYKGCPHHVALLTKMRESKENRRERILPTQAKQFNSNYVQSGISYANAVSQNNCVTNTIPPLRTTNIEKPSYQNTSETIQDLSTKIDQLGTSLQQHISSTDMKFTQLLNFIRMSLPCNNNDAN